MEIEEFKGKTFSAIEIDRVYDTITFHEDDDSFCMKHEQNCCESVYIEDICGDMEDLIGQPILLAEKVTNSDGENPVGDISFTWTFYKLSTNKGSVTIRWFGGSNGYYSEEVDIYKV